MSGRYTLDDIRTTYKRRDAWWTVLLVDPIAGRLAVPIANHTRLSPNQLTLAAAGLGAGAAGAFLDGSRTALIIGAVLFYLSFVIDCIDGKIARLKGTGSVFGTWLDYVLDRIKASACAIALMTGQYQRTDRVLFLYLAMLVMFAEMVRYLDVAKVRDTRRTMAGRIRRAALEVVAAEEIQRQMQPLGTIQAPLGAIQAPLGTVQAPLGTVRGEGPAARASQLVVIDEDHDEIDDDPEGGQSWADTVRRNPHREMHRGFQRRFGFYDRFRDMLLRHRIRTHLWSGIEFEMFVFIVGPLTGAIIPVTVASVGLLILFEMAIIYKLWMSTKDFERISGELATLVGGPDKPLGLG